MKLKDQTQEARDELANDKEFQRAIKQAENNRSTNNGLQMDDIQRSASARNV